MKYHNYNVKDFFSKKNNFMKYSDVPSHILYGIPVENPELTIIIPVYKRTDFIKDAITSALRQTTERCYQIMVIDNTVEDDAIQRIVEKFPRNRVLYIKNEKNIGMQGNWNRGIELSKSSWITMLHDDDRLKPNYIETIFQILESYSDTSISAVGVAHDIIDSSGRIIMHSKIRHSCYLISPYDLFFDIASLPIMGILLNKEAAILYGGFDDDFFPCADAHFLCKLGLWGKTLYLSESLVEYRIAQNESMNPSTLCSFIVYNHIHMLALYDTGRLNFYKWFVDIAMNVNAKNLKESNSSFWHCEDINYENIDEIIHYNNPSRISCWVYRLVRFLCKQKRKKL